MDENHEPKAEQEEPQVAKLVRSTDVDNSIKEWKLTSFEDDNQNSALDQMSAEVLNRMQQALRPKLRQQTDVLKKEAYDKAYQEGYNAGLEEGRVQGEADAKAEILAKMEPKIAQFESVLASLQTPYDLIEDKLYNELIDLALHISQTVVAKSVVENRSWLEEAIKQSVAQLPESKSAINVYLHPDDLAFIQISKPSISEKWQFHDNPNLSVGSCVVKQEHSSVINDWKLRLSDIAEQLLEGDELVEQNQQESTPQSHTPTETSPEQPKKEAD